MEEILVIEDDELLNDGLCFHLQKKGYHALPAYDLKQADSLIETKSWSLFLLDINFPDGSGLSFAKRIRKKSIAPIVFLTAQDMDEDIIQGFEAGADDYITKPFNIKIVMQRIQAILRRCKPKEIDLTMFTFGDLTIDFNTMQVKKQNVLLSLTPTELKLLFIFCKNRGKVLTRQLLLQKLWDQDGNFVDEHTLTINISRLRKKIESDSDIYIKTVYGIGYQWIKEETTI